MANDAKKKKKDPPPRFGYPKAPHLIGMDWIELPVPDALKLADILQTIGFSPRGYVGKHPLLAIGGTVFMLKTHRKLTPGPASDQTLTLQAPTDNIALKHEYMTALGLAVTPIKRQPRGDMTFTWDTGSGMVLRIVGPLRD